jgi:very-short-patch-repair endonuclease
LLSTKIIIIFDLPNNFMPKARRKKTLKGKTNTQKKIEFLEEKAVIFAKQNRENATKWEKIMYSFLKELHYKFEFQVPVITKNLKLYILDFLLTDFKLVIEVDGKSTHSSKEDQKHDKFRTKCLNKEGYEVLRFWNSQVSNLSKEQIKEIIELRILLIEQKK